MFLIVVRRHASWPMDEGGCDVRAAFFRVGWRTGYQKTNDRRKNHNCINDTQAVQCSETAQM
jgi:hypothetical protein